MSSVLAKTLERLNYAELCAAATAPGSEPHSMPPPATPGGLFDRLATFAQLQRGWDRVLTRSPLPGGDGLDVATFAVGVEMRLERLAATLRTGFYAPGPVRHFTLRKDDGSERRLGLICVADRIVQSAALELLTPIAEAAFEDGSFGYRPGRSVKAAAARIGALYRDGYRHVVEADIIGYFDNVPHAPLLEDVARLVDDRRFLWLIRLWLGMSGGGGMGLVQGAPISPLLANLYLDQLDEAVAEHGARIVRFADDFVILTKTRAAAERQLTAVTSLLRQRGLTLHPAKTRIRDFDRGFSFLGKSFLKSFVFDDDADVDEDRWGDALAAVPPPLLTAPLPSRQFRDHDLGMPQQLTGQPTPVAKPDLVRALSPRQRTLHLQGKGRRLIARDRVFIVEDGGAEIWAGGAALVDRIDIGPQARFSDTAARLAVASGTHICLIDGHGGTEAWLDAGPGARAALHLAQARHAADDLRRLALARLFIAGKVHNQRAAMQRWRSNARKSGGARADRIGAALEGSIDRLGRG